LAQWLPERLPPQNAAAVYRRRSLYFTELRHKSAGEIIRRWRMSAPRIENKHD
jgi:hypothetical protein